MENVVPGTAGGRLSRTSDGGKVESSAWLRDWKDLMENRGAENSGRFFKVAIT